MNMYAHQNQLDGKANIMAYFDGKEPEETCLSNPDHIEKWDIELLSKLACWLDGIKRGSGGKLEPLGTATIDSLWKAIHTLIGVLADPRVNPKGILWPERTTGVNEQPPTPVIAPPRPKRKVTKWLKGWISKYRREDGTDFNVFYDDYESAESAATYKLFPRIACVEINVPYEVEE